MSEKTLKTRIQNKRGTTAEWATGTAPNFVPKDGEIVAYTDVHRIKIGDGTTKVSALPFVDKVRDVTLGGESMVGNDGIVKLEKTVMTNGYVPVWNNTEGIFEDGIEKSNIATIYQLPDKHFQPFAVGDDLSGQTLYFNNQAHFDQYFTAQYTILTSSGGYSIEVGGPPNINLGKNGTHVATLYSFSNNTWLESYTLPSDFGTIETLNSKGGSEVFSSSKPSIWYTLGLGPAEDYINIDVEDVYKKIPAVIDTLTNSSTKAALSANQGRLLDLDKAPNNHASTSNTYGLGNATNYGHVKLISGDLNGKTAQDGYAASQSHTHSQYALKANPSFTGNATIGGNLTVNGTATFQNEVRVNSSAGTLGQVLMSQGGGNSPQWKDIPTPSNMVTTDTTQTITGNKSFTGTLAVDGSNAYFANTANNANGSIIDCYENEGNGDSIFSVYAKGADKGEVNFGDGAVDVNISLGQYTYISSNVILGASSTSYPRSTVSAAGMTILSSSTVATNYGATSITRQSGNNGYTISLPSGNGTLALTNQIPIKTATLSGTTLSITLS